MKREQPGELRLALAGGGTGGHIVPGRHVLEAFAAEDSLADVIWFHSGRAVEERVMEGLDAAVGRASFEKVVLAVEPVGGGAPGPVRLVTRTPAAVRVARRTLRRHGSELLFGLGGFTTLPAVLAARSLRIPVVLLEINAAPGKATRVLAPLCTRVLHAWPGTMPARPGTRHLLVGPPVGVDFVPSRDPAERERARRVLGFPADRPLLVVLGGSQGAGALNSFLRGALPRLLDHFQILHQVGPGRMGEGDAFGAEGYQALEYVTDVPLALRAAELVLCRGGASTVAEIAVMQVPAVVVPYPDHVDQHQEKNARQLGDGVCVLPETQLEGRGVAQLLDLLRSAPAREAMRAALARSVPAGAAARIAACLLEQRRSSGE